MTKTKIYKLEVLVLGLNGSEEDMIHRIKDGNFAEVKTKEVVEVDWSDDHPLNRQSTSHAAYLELFPDKNDAYVKKIAELEAKLKAIENRVRDFALDVAYPDDLIAADQDQDPKYTKCEECGGTGHFDHETPCQDCCGTGDGDHGPVSVSTLEGDIDRRREEWAARDRKEK